MENNLAVAVKALNRHFISAHPIESSRYLETMPPETCAKILEPHSVADVAAALEIMPPVNASAILLKLSPYKARALFHEFNPNHAVTLFGHFDSENSQNLFAILDPVLQSEFRQLMTYPEDSAGRLMDKRVLAFREGMPVRLCLRRIRDLKYRPARTVFLIDSDNKLTAQVEMQDLALAEPRQLLRELAHPLKAVMPVTAPKEDIVEKLEEHRMSNMPVVDLMGRLVGVVRYEILVKAVEEDATADIQSMFGASKEERALSTPLFSVKNRLPWLQINLLTAFLAAGVVGLFEDIIAKFTALAVLLPVVAGQSGNAGAQALAVTMRGLALHEISPRSWWTVLWKEMQVGLTNGLAIALTTSLGVYIWSGSTGLALVIGLAMILSMICAGLAGASVPILLTRLGLDPATASSIILTTVTDVVGFLSFLGIATLLSSML